MIYLVTDFEYQYILPNLSPKNPSVVFQYFVTILSKLYFQILNKIVSRKRRQKLVDLFR